MSKRLLELAEVRHEEIEIAGEKITVREPSALQMLENRRIKNGDPAEKREPDQAGALAYLIRECCVDIEGKPLYDEREALILANGRSEVALPLINAITGWISREKKVSTPTSASGID